jgi:hypothetical protein
MKTEWDIFVEEQSRNIGAGIHWFGMQEINGNKVILLNGVKNKAVANINKALNGWFSSLQYKDDSAGNIGGGLGNIALNNDGSNATNEPYLQSNGSNMSSGYWNGSAYTQGSIGTTGSGLMIDAGSDTTTKTTSTMGGLVSLVADSNYISSEGLNANGQVQISGYFNAGSLGAANTNTTIGELGLIYQNGSRALLTRLSVADNENLGNGNGTTVSINNNYPAVFTIIVSLY